MSKIIKASLDEIVEAVEKQVGGWEAEDRDQRALINNIRTALEKFVVEEETKKGGDDGTGH